MAYVLGIDTGGTYTDSVIVEEDTKKILCWSKAETTKKDLCAGIRNSLQGLNFCRFDEITRVSLSTTLATNAVVEGTQCPTGLLAIGKLPQCETPARKTALIEGRLNIRGQEERPLDIQQAREVILNMAEEVEAFAISGYASVRNPQQEQRLFQLVRDLTAKPVFCAHRLCGNLGYDERTVTTVLNASLTKVIDTFCRSALQVLEEFSIHAPVLIVKGDGSLMRIEDALHRPVETVLSGPAASVAGARFLTGLDNAFVLDMGGTTTDLANLTDGTLQISEHGARLDGWYTQVRAVQISTHGIGGDSRIWWDPGQHAVRVGPQRVCPWGRISGGAEEERGLTPTDCVRSGQTSADWDGCASQAALRRLAERAGRTPEQLLDAARERVYRELTLSCLQAAADFEGQDIDLRRDETACYLLEKLWDREPEFFRLQLQLKKPIIAVGGPVRHWLPEVGKRLNCEVVIPEFAQVANALGATLLQMEERCEVIIRKENGGGDAYVCYLPDRRTVVKSKETAVALAKREAERTAVARATAAGCTVPTVDVQVREVVSQNMEDSSDELIETRICVKAFGTPC